MKIKFSRMMMSSIWLYLYCVVSFRESNMNRAQQRTLLLKLITLLSFDGESQHFACGFFKHVARKVMGQNRD